jgi:hypothetical protein
MMTVPSAPQSCTDLLPEIKIYYENLKRSLLVYKVSQLGAFSLALEMPVWQDGTLGIKLPTCVW